MNLFNFLFLGAFVIGTVGTEEKAEKAKACGADEVVVYSNKDFVVEVNRITQGAGVNVIYDGVGKATFHKGKLLIKRGELSRRIEARLPKVT